MEGLNTHAPDTQTTQDTRNYTPSSAVDDIAKLLVDEKVPVSQGNDLESIYGSIKPRGVSDEDGIEGFRQAAEQINGRDRGQNRKTVDEAIGDVEQSQYLPEENEGSDNDHRQQAFQPQQLDRDTVNQAIDWLQGEVDQVTQAFSRGLITEAQYLEGIEIAKGYARQIENVASHVQAQEQAQQAYQAQQLEQANAFVAQHIPNWDKVETRQQTIAQMYNFLRDVGVPEAVINSTPGTPELVVAIHKMMKDVHKARQANNKQLQAARKAKQVKQATPMTERKAGVHSIHDQTNQIARLLMGIGGA